ncbi:uncharacterized protein LOC134559282 [Prinia subflava]|uniref:uncharacterized protein LOC134559282 n=1 Tax=Prinia subflava TaxID=208062 RepID=UPI002FE0F2F0
MGADDRGTEQGTGTGQQECKRRDDLWSCRHTQPDVLEHGAGAELVDKASAQNRAVLLGRGVVPRRRNSTCLTTEPNSCPGEQNLERIPAAHNAAPHTAHAASTDPGGPVARLVPLPPPRVPPSPPRHFGLICFLPPPQGQLSEEFHHFPCRPLSDTGACPEPAQFTGSGGTADGTLRGAKPDEDTAAASAEAPDTLPAGRPPEPGQARTAPIGSSAPVLSPLPPLSPRGSPSSRGSSHRPAAAPGLAALYGRFPEPQCPGSRHPRRASAPSAHRARPGRPRRTGPRSLLRPPHRAPRPCIRPIALSPARRPPRPAAPGLPAPFPSPGPCPPPPPGAPALPRTARA